MNQSKPIPEWLLERYLLDELPRKKRRQFEKELEQNPALRAELENLRVADRQILSTYPADQMIPEILKKAALIKPKPEAPSRWRLAWMAAPVLALAVFLLVVLPPFIQKRPAVSENSRSDDYIGTKGSRHLSAPGLKLYRKSGGIDEILRNGDQARAGDLLQIAYIAGGEIYGVILSIDGAGAVILHFPETPDGGTALQSGPRVFLPQAYELDRAPRFERFFFVTAKETIATTVIMEKARELAAGSETAMTGKLDLPKTFRQFSLTLRK